MGSTDLSGPYQDPPLPEAVAKSIIFVAQFFMEATRIKIIRDKFVTAYPDVTTLDEDVLIYQHGVSLASLYNMNIILFPVFILINHHYKILYATPLFSELDSRLRLRTEKAVKCLEKIDLDVLNFIP